MIATMCGRRMPWVCTLVVAVSLSMMGVTSSNSLPNCPRQGRRSFAFALCPLDQSILLRPLPSKAVSRPANKLLRKPKLSLLSSVGGDKEGNGRIPHVDGNVNEGTSFAPGVPITSKERASHIITPAVKSAKDGTLRAEADDLATALWQSGWRSLWAQVIVSALSAAALLLSALMQRSAYKVAAIGATGAARAALRSAIGEGLVAAAFALLTSLFHMLWTWGYTRAGVRVRSASDKSNTDGDVVLLDKCRKARQSLDVGSSIAIVGAIAAFIGAEQVLGNMVIRMLLARGLNIPFWLTNPPARLQALDLFAMQASLLALASHLVGLFFTQKLRSKVPEELR